MKTGFALWMSVSPGPILVTALFDRAIYCIVSQAGHPGEGPSGYLEENSVKRGLSVTSGLVWPPHVSP